MNTDKLAICTTYDAPEFDAEGQPTKRWRFQSAQPMSSVVAQLKEVLRQIPWPNATDAEDNALNNAEFVRLADLEEASPAPSGEPFAAMLRMGHGYGVGLFVKEPHGHAIMQMMMVKFRCSQDFAYEVTRVVNEALYDGLFVIHEPPVVERKELISRVMKSVKAMIEGNGLGNLYDLVDGSRELESLLACAGQFPDHDVLGAAVTRTLKSVDKEFFENDRNWSPHDLDGYTELAAAVGHNPSCHAASVDDDDAENPSLSIMGY